MGSIANVTYSILSRIEGCATKDEVELAKSDFKKKMILEKKKGEDVGSFVKAAIICGDLKVLRLFHEAFPKSFEKLASPYMDTTNKRMANFLAETLSQA